MLRIFLTDDALSSKVPQLTLRIAEGDCIVKFQFIEHITNLPTNYNSLRFSQERTCGGCRLFTFFGIRRSVLFRQAPRKGILCLMDVPGRAAICLKCR
jgi:hypothetical protein